MPPNSFCSSKAEAAVSPGFWFLLDIRIMRHYSLGHKVVGALNFNIVNLEPTQRLNFNDWLEDNFTLT
ncbi:MAG: hypothetical protein A2Y00_01670 [Omnitrophica WOR_2 bacterium GWF2_43_52]|nr:MAG: hypothetical protein A2062_06640 [Omnitrophica WOR_2 bacterium GWA2_44_7]OGX20065.1 MAG: hypothetical protein A2Y00_01670 [Omnitrophica WOR_2 bacterium GWF2_43_52]OGX55254.1 MAG: hypothetical protein A2460_05090 [Omnitrophica WOR_2 bacterium RIFOXYC2_FULL_43_9]